MCLRQREHIESQSSDLLKSICCDVVSLCVTLLVVVEKLHRLVVLLIVLLFLQPMFFFNIYVIVELNNV